MHQLTHRQAGILLHPTSLPEQGTFGKNAYLFVDFLVRSGFSIWQVLPLGVTNDNLSPYQSLSAHAGNPHLIDLNLLVDKGWLDAGVYDDYHRAQQQNYLQTAYQYFIQQNDSESQQQYRNFCQQHD